MYYQETCQLGFNEVQSPNQDLFFIGGEDEANQYYQSAPNNLRPQSPKENYNIVNK